MLMRYGIHAYVRTYEHRTNPSGLPPCVRSLAYAFAYERVAGSPEEGAKEAWLGRTTYVLRRTTREIEGERC